VVSFRNEPPQPDAGLAIESHQEPSPLGIQCRGVVKVWGGRGRERNRQSVREIRVGVREYKCECAGECNYSSKKGFPVLDLIT